MAFDLLSGEIDPRSWARGDAVVSMAEAGVRRLPLKKIAIGGVVALGALWLLSRRGAEAPRHVEPEGSNSWMRTTQQIPKQSMHDLVYGRKV